MKRNQVIKGKFSAEFMKRVIELVHAAKLQVVRQTNSVMVFTYFQVGKLIVEHEQGGNIKAGYGAATIKQLSKELTKQFGKGFSEDNLANMREFYSRFKSKLEQLPISETLSRKSVSNKKTQTTPADLPQIKFPINRQ